MEKEPSGKLFAWVRNIFRCITFLTWLERNSNHGARYFEYKKARRKGHERVQVSAYSIFLLPITKPPNSRALVKANRASAAKILAKEIASTRKTIERMNIAKAQLNSVSMTLQTSMC